MSNYRQSYVDSYEAPSPALRSRPPAKSAVAWAVRTIKLTVADALYAYAVTGSALATLLVLAAPRLELFAHCIFHGKG
jgi:hypothetical protein